MLTLCHSKGAAGSRMAMVKRRNLLVVCAVAAAIVIAAAVAVLILSFAGTRVTFVLMDALSGGAVWDATVTIQDRQIRSFYQSNLGPVPMTISHLRPGLSTITVTAPGYRGQSIPVRILHGGNRLPRPIELDGLEIPGLDHFVMVEDRVGPGLRVQLRPVSASGAPIQHHPCVDLSVAVRVCAQTRAGVVDPRSGEYGSERGPVLFEGPLPWSWDASPTADFRYSVTIPFERLSREDFPLLVVDYLVIVPGPTPAGRTDTRAVMAGLPSLADPDALRSYLEGARSAGGMRYFISTSWNVEGPA